MKQMVRVYGCPEALLRALVWWGSERHFDSVNRNTWLWVKRP